MWHFFLRSVNTHTHTHTHTHTYIYIYIYICTYIFNGLLLVYRQLHHESVVRFLGIISTDTPQLPPVITEHRLVSLRDRLNTISRRASLPMINKDVLPTILHSIVSGLVYIHSKNLVHPEVSLDSVTVSKYFIYFCLCDCHCKKKTISFW